MSTNIDSLNPILQHTFNINHPITIDFLVPCGGKGGVEIVLNDTAMYLKSLGIHIRIVQLVYNDSAWPDSSLEYYTIQTNRAIADISDYIPLCEQYLNELKAPDIIIATPLPMLTMIIKLALLNCHMNAHIISWLHGPLHIYDENAVGGLDCLKYADLVMVLNQGSYSYIKNNSDIRVALVKNPIDFESLQYHDIYNPECRTLVYIGRLSSEKNVSLIIDSISHTKEQWKLIIIGDGDERTQLKELCNSLNLNDNVTFTGWLNNPWNSVIEASSLVLASSYEGFCLACYEALATGIPVISTPVNGVTDIIKDGYNGYIYSDENELVNILDNVILQSDIQSSDCRSSVSNYNKPLVLRELSQYILSVL